MGSKFHFSCIIKKLLKAVCFIFFLFPMGIVEPAVFVGNAFAFDRIPVFVSILPQKYFLEKIGGDRVSVSVMVPPGAGPATYEPKPKQMAALARASAYFAIGVPFERFQLPKIHRANPDMQIIHMEKGIERIPMEVRHTHGSGAHQRQKSVHAHDADENPDPHVWLSPPLVKRMAEKIFHVLSDLEPGSATLFKQHYEQFSRQIDALHRDIESILSKAKGKRFIVFHPSWGYFAKAYGLEQIPVEIQGKEPKPSDLVQLIRMAREQDIHVVFAQPQFSSKSAKVIAREIRGGVVFIDPLAENWAENLKTAAKKIREALE